MAGNFVAHSPAEPITYRSVVLSSGIPSSFLSLIKPRRRTLDLGRKRLDFPLEHSSALSQPHPQLCLLNLPPSLPPDPPPLHMRPSWPGPSLPPDDNRPDSHPTRPRPPSIRATRPPLPRPIQWSPLLRQSPYPSSRPLPPRFLPSPHRSSPRISHLVLTRLTFHDHSRIDNLARSRPQRNQRARANRTPPLHNSHPRRRSHLPLAQGSHRSLAST